MRLSSLPAPVWLVLATIVCLVPFANKAVHIDDPLFLWTAEQIQRHPFDFFGFSVNWYGTVQPVGPVFNNPPLAAFFLALVQALAGSGEVALHLAFLLPAIGAVLGIFYLAREFTAQPALAAAFALCTPAFLVASTTLMSDVPMLALWLWTLVLWERGLKTKSTTKLLAAGFIAGLCVMTKFIGVCVVPLLLVRALLIERRAGAWLLAWLVPLAIIAAYEVFTRHRYGQGLLVTAGLYSSDTRPALEAVPRKLLVGLVFTGGTLFPLLVFSPLLWSRRWLAGWLAVLALVFIVLPPAGSIGVKWTALAQGAFFGLIGLIAMALTVAHIWRNLDPDTLWLGLWVAGAFVFCAFFNWTINARSLLPLVPPLAVIVARGLVRYASTTREPSAWWRLAWPLVPSVVVALLVAQADYALAGTARTAAYRIGAQYTRSAGTLWFQGHWGFQYYMMKSGGVPMDMWASQLREGDLVAVASTASNTFPLPRDAWRIEDSFELDPTLWLSTMNAAAGSGFYADDWGPLPFAFGRPAAEQFYVLRITKPIALKPPTATPPQKRG